MFQIYKYQIINIYKSKSQVFWSLAFPIILGTFFHLAFSNMIDEDEIISNIPVAVAVSEDSRHKDSFGEVLDSLKEETDYLNITYTDKEEGQKQLQNNQADGFILVDDNVELTVKSNGISQSILKSIVDQYLQTYDTIQNIAAAHPEKIEAALLTLSEGSFENTEITLNDRESMNMTLQYFYALIAMAAMFGAYFGLHNTNALQANLSTVAIRRNIAPTAKIKALISDFLAALSVHFLNLMVVLAYLTLILKVDFGDKVPYLILTIFLGSACSIAIGYFIGTFIKLENRIKHGLVTAVSLFLSFLSGLMAGNVQDYIEHNFPVINRINPAALIKDSLYSLNIYDNYNKYFQNISTLCIITVILIAASVFIMRREKYDSI